MVVIISYYIITNCIINALSAPKSSRRFLECDICLCYAIYYFKLHYISLHYVYSILIIYMILYYPGDGRPGRGGGVRDAQVGRSHLAGSNTI